MFRVSAHREVAVPPSGLPLPPGAAVEVACAFAYTDQTALALAGPAAASLAVDEAVAEVHVGVAPSANEPGLCDVRLCSPQRHYYILLPGNVHAPAARGGAACSAFCCMTR